MGRQVEFFMGESDEASFLGQIFIRGCLFVDRKVKILDFEGVGASKELALYISKPEINYFTNKDGYLDIISSEVIDFLRCRSWSEKTIQCGRLWGATRYYGENDEKIIKSKEFLDILESYLKWIKNNYRISKCKMYYIGEEAYRLYKEEGYKCQ